MHYLCFNGIFSDAATPVIAAANKGYRYGDGFFETLRVHRGTVPLWDLHRSRILKSLSLLNYRFAQGATLSRIYENIIELCHLNGCAESARVRLSFSNGDGGLFEASALHYLAEAMPFAATPEDALVLGIYNELAKEAHRFSELKLSGNFIYSRAAQYCNERGWNDSILLNKEGRVVETTMTNLFWIKNGALFTPPVTDGCVAGVFRTYLLEAEPGITERSCTPETLREADELFLTNALRGIRAVAQFDGTYYAGNLTKTLQHRHNQLLFA
ncbi:aminotransferase class IV [Niabella hirudinis]|uniref:aminotransferase class IV n=1 Tax=Niabella hirudinis TaxID=1285929 RepID=UPI003EBFC76C